MKAARSRSVRHGQQFVCGHSCGVPQTLAKSGSPWETKAVYCPADNSTVSVILCCAYVVNYSLTNAISRFDAYIVCTLPVFPEFLLPNNLILLLATPFRPRKLVRKSVPFHCSLVFFHSFRRYLIYHHSLWLVSFPVVAFPFSTRTTRAIRTLRSTPSPSVWAWSWFFPVQLAGFKVFCQCPS